MRCRTSILTLAVVATAAVAPASAQAAPTLQLTQPCFSDGDVLGATGAGYSPNGAVDIGFEAVAGGFTGTATTDPSGNLTAGLELAEDAMNEMLGAEAARSNVFAATRDRNLEAAGQPSTATASAVLSRWFVAFRSGTINPRRSLRVGAFGFTHAAGRILYVHYVRGDRRRGVKSLGRLTGACGDRTVTLARAFPFANVATGRWTLVFNNSMTSHRTTPSIAIPVRVGRAAAARAATATSRHYGTTK